MSDNYRSNKQQHKVDLQWKNRAFILAFLDVLVIGGSYFFALFLRFDMQISHIPSEYMEGYRYLILPLACCYLVVFYGARLYHSIWRFASAMELLRIMEAMLFNIIINLLYHFFWFQKMPISCWFMGWVFTFIGVTVLRFGYRFLRIWRNSFEKKHLEKGADRVMVIGAGSAGKMLIHEMISSSHLSDKVVCIIDDNPYKHGRYLDGVPIVGGRESIPEVVEEYHVTAIYYAIPVAKPEDKKDILNICNNTGCRLMTIPGIYQLVNGQVSVSNLRPVDLEDLLGRAQVIVDNAGIHDFIHDKVIMVTGGGGSIGSELCRQIAKEQPSMLVLFDIYENNVYAIEQELKRHMPQVHMVALIGSVRNTNRVNDVLTTYCPDVIFHAAAHKHVPLMEVSPNEAIKNNVFGTYKLAKAAVEHHIPRFVLISTDKAVNPTNIMGASKRLCEMIVQMFNREGKTEFAAVRFGNVLGSNGSVIPLFKQQIAEGGPVTVTHPEMTRFFMTIPEAVSLVLQAAVYAKGGEIFVLDMGDPVKIDDMARNLIRLSGYEPDVDIKITYTGLRPGEKMYEEILMDEEGLSSTPNHLIHIGKPIKMDDEVFREQLKALERACTMESDDIRDEVAAIVPTYQPWE